MEVSGGFEQGCCLQQSQLLSCANAEVLDEFAGAGANAHDAAGHDARGGRGQIIRGTLERRIGQEVRGRLEGDLEEGRCAALNAHAVQWLVPALLRHTHL